MRSLGWQVSPLVHAFPARSRTDLPDTPAALPRYFIAGLMDAEMAGFTGVEFPSALIKDDQRARLVAAELKRRSLVATGHLTQLRADADDASVRRIGELAANAAAAGLGDLIVVVESGDDPLLLRNTLVAIAERVVALGIRVHWHPHVPELADISSLQAVTQELPEECGVCLDVGWVLRGGLDLRATVKELGRRLTYVQVRDVQVDGCWAEAVGRGRLSSSDLVAALDDVGYEGWVVAEAKYERGTTITGSVREHARWSAASMHAWTGTTGCST